MLTMQNNNIMILEFKMYVKHMTVAQKAGEGLKS